MAVRSWLGYLSLGLMAFLCLSDLNAVGEMALGVGQLVSPVLLVLCIVLLLVFRLTVYRDLGSTGRLYFAFTFVYVLIGGLMHLSGDSEGLLRSYAEVRELIPAVLIIAAAAVASRHLAISFGVDAVIKVLFWVSLFVPVAIIAVAALPDQYARYLTFEGKDMYRASGTFGNANAAGGAACVAAAIAFASMSYLRQWFTGPIAIGLAAVGTFLTFSRGAILIFIVLAALQVVISPGGKGWIGFVVGAFIVAGMIYMVMSLTAQGNGANLAHSEFKRVESIAKLLHGDISDETTTGGRGHLAMEGIKEWLRSPIIGNGLGTQREIASIGIGPHNLNVYILGQAGIVPFAIFWWMLIRLGLDGWRCKTPAVRALVLGFVLIFVSRMMMSHGLLSQRIYNFMFGACFGLLAACAELKAAGLDNSTGGCNPSRSNSGNRRSTFSGNRSALAAGPTPGMPGHNSEVVEPRPRPVIRPT
jgi:hypothetical protein